MNLTNKYNLPNAIMRAIANDSYNKGECDFSVTELLTPSRQWALKQEHEEELQEDVSDRLWSLYGQVAHLIVERANLKDLAEKRFFMEVDEYTLSGQIDSLSIEDGILSDFKFTTVWGFMKGAPPKDEWVAQLNMQLELLRQNGLDANELRIVGLLRDYQISQIKKNPKYPKTPVAQHQIEMWSRETTLKFIRDRVRSHLNALEDLPKCSASETWQGRRCASYCQVSDLCDQFKKAQQTGLIEGDATWNSKK